MNTSSLGKNLLILCLIIIVGFIAYSMMYAPDRRTAGEKVGDAIDQLGDRTPADKLGDAVDDMKKSTNQP
jgi:hypothetical protein